MLWTIRIYPEAMQYMIDRGRSREEVEGLPVQQVLATYIMGDYERSFDELRAWTKLPYWQGIHGLRQAERPLDAGRRTADSPLLAFLPAVATPWTRLVLVDRAIAMLQTVEAIGGYAAAHNGLLPATLSELTETPAPLDPITGRAFDYEYRGDTAVLLAPAPPGERAQLGTRYEISVRK